MKFLFIFLFLPTFIFSQKIINCTVIDKKTNAAIPFASIGIVGKSVGTVSNENGCFEFQTFESQKKDSLKISAIGYMSLSFLISDLLQNPTKKVLLNQQALLLDEVVIKPKKVKYKRLGTTDYTIDNCTGFVDIGGNWKGSEAAILIKNNRNCWMENFSFYVIQNKYTDSLRFRLMFYNKIQNDWVGETFLKKPIVFKVGLKKGEFTLDLKDYNIRTDKDFFVSLECLMDEMDITKFCYSGTYSTSSYFKVKAFSKWRNTRGTGNGGGGADFNVKVSYTN